MINPDTKWPPHAFKHKGGMGGYELPSTRERDAIMEAFHPERVEAEIIEEPTLRAKQRDSSDLHEVPLTKWNLFGLFK